MKYRYIFIFLLIGLAMGVGGIFIVLDKNTLFRDIYSDKMIWITISMMLFALLLILTVRYYFRSLNLKRECASLENRVKETMATLKYEKEVLNCVFTSVKEGVVVLNRELVIVNINKSAYETLECTWSVIGEPFKRICKLGDSSIEGTEFTFSVLSGVIDSGEKIIIPKGALFISSQGGVHNIEGSISPFHDSSGEVNGVVVIFREITDETKRSKLFKMSTDMPQSYITQQRIKSVSKDEIKEVKEKVKKRLLISSDVESNILLLRALLKQDYILDKAYTASEAFEMFKKRRYDAILMDVKVTYTDEIDVILEIRKISAIPILVQGYLHENLRKECFDAGCDEFLPKSLNSDELQRLLKEYLQ